MFEFVRKNEQLLMANLTASNELLAILKSKGLLTQTMVDDLAGVSSRERRVEKLFELVFASKASLGEAEVAKRFVEAFDVGGHSMLADVIRDTQDGTSRKLVDEIFTHIPRIAQNLQADEKEKLTILIENTLKKTVTTEDWKKHLEDKHKLMESKLREVEYTKDSETTAKSMQDRIDKLTKQVERAQAESASKDQMVNALNERLTREIANHQNQLAKMTYGNQAQNNSIHKLASDVQSSRSEMARLVERMRLMMNERDYTEPDTDSVQGFIRALTRNVETLISRQRELERIRDKYQQAKNERSILLLRFGVDKTEHERADIVEAYDEFIKRKEQVQREVLAMYKNARNNDMRQMLSQVELSELRKDLNEREKKINELQTTVKQVQLATTVATAATASPRLVPPRRASLAYEPTRSSPNSFPTTPVVAAKSLASLNSSASTPLNRRPQLKSATKAREELRGKLIDLKL